ncbi:MAG TPA: enoyl-CoA hydratase-related protein [Phenylobacterium sp.]|nr:enoyl-CoA hydratase-related protein [Phenylobacterium sp.]
MVLVETRLEGGVLALTLNDPERRNPLSAEMAAEIGQWVTRARDDREVRCVLITGKGKAFCAGGDLEVLDTLSPAELKRFMASSQAVTRDIAQLPVPVVMAVNGAAAGAGFSLAMSGDIVLASETAFFLPAFSRIGAAPDLGLAHTLHRSIGLHRTSRVLLLGEALDAAAAAAAGLVSEVIPPAELEARARQVADELAQGPTVALGLTKSLLRTAATGDLPVFLECEASAQAIAFSTDDFREGVAAFRERRPPRFSGS